MDASIIFLEDSIERYKRVNRITDPIWGQIEITKSGPWGIGEQAILDTPWVQRLRQIHQLQSTWWVFPGAEHSRFMHLLGTMHLAGKLTRQVYSSLVKNVEGTPSLPLVEETMRLAGLLHDIGHGPFSHFFDWYYGIPVYGIDHEMIGRKIILEKLYDLIAGIKQSPLGFFASGENIDPNWVAWLMDSRNTEDFLPPEWLLACKSILCGPASADNMDYVPRDAYMCGIGLSSVKSEIERIIGYSTIAEGTVVLHSNAIGALETFLAARLSLYMNVYFHRTARRVDLMMADIFPDTMEEMGVGNPLENLEKFLEITNWTVFTEVQQWLKEPEGSKKRKLGVAWDRLRRRDLDWSLAFETQLPGVEVNRAVLTLKIKMKLPDRKGLDFRVDIASANIISQNPLVDDGFIAIYDPLKGVVSKTAASTYVPRLPQYNRIIRVFSKKAQDDEILQKATEEVLRDLIKE